MKLNDLAILLFACLTIANLGIAQQSKWSVEVQAYTYFSNPSSDAVLEGRIILCGIVPPCITEEYRLYNVSLQLAQIATSYQLSKSWSFKTGLAYNYFSLGGLRGNSFFLTDVIDSRRDRFIDWQWMVQADYHIFSWWQLGLGYRWRISPQRILDLGFSFSADPLFQVGGSQSFIQSNWYLPLDDKLKVHLILNVVNESRWYLKENLHWSFGGGFSYDL